MCCQTKWIKFEGVRIASKWEMEVQTTQVELDAFREVKMKIKQTKILRWVYTHAHTHTHNTEWDMDKYLLTTKL